MLVCMHGESSTICCRIRFSIDTGYHQKAQGERFSAGHLAYGVKMSKIKTNVQITKTYVTAI